MTAFYVYEHIRKDTGAVFYVGKGCNNRAYITKGRNNHWVNVVKNSKGFFVRFVVENEDEEFAYFVEQEKIDQHLRLGNKLTNLTGGGEGSFQASEETKSKMSNSHLGKKNPRFDKNSIRQKRLRGELKVSKETMRENMKANHWSKTGAYTPQKGYKMSDEAKLKMRKAHEARPLQECPCCGYIGKPVTISRWHGNKCKLKGNQNG